MKSKTKATITFKLRTFIAILPYHCLVIGGVAIFAFILNKWIEAVIYLVSYFSLRYKFPTTFHAESILYCMLITNGLFITSIILCPDANTYIFGGVIFAFLTTALLWFIQCVKNLIEDKECAETLVKDLNEKLIKLENPQETFIDRCRKAKLSQRDTEIAVKYYIEKLTAKEIWLWLCKTTEYDSIEWDSVYQLLWRIGKKLNK